MDATVRRHRTFDVRSWLLHPFFVSVGGTMLMAAFASDIMYSKTSLMQW